MVSVEKGGLMKILCIRNGKQKGQEVWTEREGTQDPLQM